MVMFDRQDSNVEWPGDEQLRLQDPGNIELALEVADSDCDPLNALAVGNGEQCRAWNHEGCEDADNCPFKHAFDGLSARDDLCVLSFYSSCRLSR